MRPANWTHNREVFYKYTTRRSGKAILGNRSLRWSSPRLFNDPFDIQFDLHLEFDHGQAKARILDSLWHAHYGDDPPPAENLLGRLISQYRGRFPRMTRAEFELEFGDAVEGGLLAIRRVLPETQLEYRNHLSDVKVLCLSEVNDNILMWSHYSEQHMGMVLEFKCIEKLDSVFGVAQPVDYCEKMPRLFDEDFLVQMQSGQVNMNVRQIYDKSVLSKATDWAYEKEWRLVLNRTRTEQDYEDISFSREELSAVYLGCRTPQEEQFAVIELVSMSFPCAKIFQARKHEREFRIVFEEIATLASLPNQSQRSS
jgi:Protein of unknown function (DUF2971)